MSIIKYGKFDILHAGSVSLYCNLHIHRLYTMITSCQALARMHLGRLCETKDRCVSCDVAVSCYLYEVSMADE